MAYTRVNWTDLPSTDTPINAANLNIMDEGIYDLNPYILYNNASGNNTTISLNDSLVNYEYIDIFFEAENVWNSIKVYNPNGKTIETCSNVLFNDASYYKNSKWSCSGTSITFSAGNTYNVIGNAISGFANNQKAVKIHRVIGYK